MNEHQLDNGLGDEASAATEQCSNTPSAKPQFADAPSDHAQLANVQLANVQLARRVSGPGELGCCGWRWMGWHDGGLRWAASLSLLVLVGLALAGGYWLRGWTNGDSGAVATSGVLNATTSSDEAIQADLVKLWARSQSEQHVQAATAATGESFAMATGSIDEDVEGLFLLDFVTGELQCAVLNYRTGRFTSLFRANVQADLGVDPAKRPKYLMTTGMINFPRGASAARPGNSVVYVMDTSSGNFAAYAIPWRRELASIGRPQAAAMILMDMGRARTAAIRE